jgi:hypothetical protein
MRLAAKILRYAAFGIMTLFGVFGGLFVAGYAFEDLDTWTAIASTAAWFVPTVVLSVLALWRPDVGAPVLVGVAAVAALLTVIDAVFTVVDIDAVGPVMAIAVFATAVALGFLGLHREALSGLLLIMLAVAQFVATVAGHSDALNDPGGGPGLGDLLTTSSGVVVVPMAVVGVLFLVAGALDHEPPGLRHLPPTTRAAH